ncbi:MAG TPA: RNA polymerase sigma factor [Opitutaceae bacterium]|nr:RNA polymerase sigma factor [Opitutaceae bacterium]
MNESPSSAAAGMSDHAAFTTFMRSYQDMVYTTAIRLLGNQAAAEDVSQEVFLRAYEHFDDLRDGTGAGGWLKTVSTNLSLNHLQRYRKRWSFFSELLHRDDSGEADETPIDFPAGDDFFADFDAADRRAWVQQALAKLPDKQRVPLVLYHFEDLSYEQIAERLGVSLAKVKTDILRARQALAQHLNRAAAERRELTT